MKSHALRPSASSTVAVSTVAIIVSLLATGTPVPARAAPAASAPADDGRALLELDARAHAAYDAGAYENAIALFREAHDKSGDPNYLYNISASFDRLGRLQEALDALDEFAAAQTTMDADTIARKRRSLAMRLEKQTLETRAATEAAPPAATPPARVPAEAVPPEVDAPERSPRHPRAMLAAGATTVALGGLGLATGLALGIVSRRRLSDARDECVDGDAGRLCPATSRDPADAARSLSIGADAAFAVGGALAVVGVTLLVVDAVKGKRRARAGALVPSIGPRGASIGWAARF